MSFDAFISYRRENGFFMAQLIYDRLRNRGINCFFDAAALSSGAFDEKILNAIHEAHTFILILPRNALNKCKNEDDWVRREIIEAVHCNKRIIPVMYDGFKWPQKWSSDIPEEIQRLKNVNGVSESKEYLPAMIEKIISYMPQDRIQTKVLLGSLSQFSVPIDTIRFFEEFIKNSSDVYEVDMAFHSGMEWRQSSRKVSILSYLIENNITVKILANRDRTMDKITDSMTQPLKKYPTYEECLQGWYELAQKNPKYMIVKTPKVPLLHRLYIIRGKFGGAVNVKYYTYANYSPADDFRLCFQSGTREYNLYLNEFEYLWNYSDDYIPASV